MGAHVGLVRPRTCGPGGSDLCRVRAICKVLFHQVASLAFAETIVNIRRFGVVGAVLAVDPGLVFEAGSGSAGQRQN